MQAAVSSAQQLVLSWRGAGVRPHLFRRRSPEPDLGCLPLASPIGPGPWPWLFCRFSSGPLCSLPQEIIQKGHAVTEETFSYLLMGCIQDKKTGFRYALQVCPAWLCVLSLLLPCSLPCLCWVQVMILCALLEHLLLPCAGCFYICYLLAFPEHAAPCVLQMAGREGTRRRRGCCSSRDTASPHSPTTLGGSLCSRPRPAELTVPEGCPTHPQLSVSVCGTQESAFSPERASRTLKLRHAALIPSQHPSYQVRRWD